MVDWVSVCYQGVFRNNDVHHCLVCWVAVDPSQVFRQWLVGVSNSNRLARRRLKLWLEDDRCRFCRKPTLLPQFCTKEVIARNRDRMATIEHLDSRYNPNRGKSDNEERTTLACWRCNNDRNKIEQESIPKKILQERSSHGPNPNHSS